jgi:hypothetical protein
VTRVESDGVNDDHHLGRVGCGRRRPTIVGPDASQQSCSIGGEFTFKVLQYVCVQQAIPSASFNCNGFSRARCSDDASLKSVIAHRRD